MFSIYLRRTKPRWQGFSWSLVFDQAGRHFGHTAGRNTQACMPLQWPSEDPPLHDGHPEGYEEFDPIRRRETYSSREDMSIKTLRYTWSIPVTLRGFDSVFQRSKIVLKTTMKVSLKEEVVNIMSLKFIPCDMPQKRPKIFRAPRAQDSAIASSKICQLQPGKSWQLNKCEFSAALPVYFPQLILSH